MPFGLGIPALKLWSQQQPLAQRYPNLMQNPVFNPTLVHPSNFGQHLKTPLNTAPQALTPAFNPVPQPPQQILQPQPQINPISYLQTQQPALMPPVDQATQIMANGPGLIAPPNPTQNPAPGVAPPLYLIGDPLNGSPGLVNPLAQNPAIDQATQIMKPMTGIMSLAQPMAGMGVV